MKPYTENEHLKHMLAYGYAFILTRYNVDKGKEEKFILDPEEVIVKELQDETPIIQ